MVDYVRNFLTSDKMLFRELINSPSLNRRGVSIEFPADPLRSKLENLGSFAFRVAPPELLSSEVLPSAFLDILPPKFDFCCFLPTSGERPKVEMRSAMSLSSSSKL